MGAINQMNKFIPNQANLCAALGPLLKKQKMDLGGRTRKNFQQNQ